MEPHSSPRMRCQSARANASWHRSSQSRFSTRRCSTKTSDVTLKPWARELETTTDFVRANSKWNASSAEASRAFSSSAFAWAYDKGYRQAFQALGYGGFDDEFATAMANLNANGGIVLDCSCGTGDITRRLARSKKWDRVVAIDFAEAMCARCRARCEGEDVDVYRADVADLPFVDGAFEDVHSSAGAHGWGDPERGFEELYRVLKRGGAALVSTVVLLKPIGLEEEYVRTRKANTPFWNANAVRVMMENAGFEDVELVVEDRCFVQFRARK